MNKKIVVTSLAIIIIGILVVFLLPNEKKKIHKELRLIEDIASKHAGENSLQAMKKASKLTLYFTDPCWLSVERRNFEGNFSIKEIISNINFARSYFTNVNVKFYDVTIDFKEKKTAEVHMTMRLTGKDQGEYWGESHEVETIMKKNEGMWLFAEVKIVLIQSK